MISKWGDGANWELDSNNSIHEATYLKLDCSKAVSRLKWQPKWKIEDTLNLIIEWHQVFINKQDVRKECLKQIHNYNS
jgi:CDP-glucose 4,6-dehydratase